MSRQDTYSSRSSWGPARRRRRAQPGHQTDERRTLMVWAHSRFMLLNERFQPGQRLAPLLGNEIEVGSDLCDRLGLEHEEVLATRSDAAHDSGVLQHAQVLGDSLPCQGRA